jgi:hypothetical protein
MKPQIIFLSVSLCIFLVVLMIYQQPIIVHQPMVVHQPPVPQPEQHPHRKLLRSHRLPKRITFATPDEVFIEKFEKKHKPRSVLIRNQRIIGPHQELQSGDIEKGVLYSDHLFHKIPKEYYHIPIQKDVNDDAVIRGFEKKHYQHFNKTYILDDKSLSDEYVSDLK